tara:strand:+ start:13876 stop:14364 length:489 start_codon:yes stop_codon:yes gene_type:complete
MRILISICLLFQLNQGSEPKEISKDGMKISWSHSGKIVNFKISAPTDGWIAIGFNPKKGISDTYLIMARIINNKVEVLEHYTLSPGNYKSLEALGDSNQAVVINGKESQNKTEIEFSLPISSKDKYRYDLSPGNSYNLLYAYSQSDDFQHHSIMRNSCNIKL